MNTNPAMGTKGQHDDPASSDKGEAEQNVGGEDEGSTEKEGEDGHLHEDQKSQTLPL